MDKSLNEIENSFFEILNRITNDKNKTIADEDIKKLQEIKEYFKNNPTCELKKSLLTKVAEYYKVKLTDLDFIKVLNSNKDYRHLRYIKMYKTLPLMDPKSITLYHSLISQNEDYSNIVKYFEDIFNLIDKYGTRIYGKNERKMILDFVELNNDKLTHKPQKYYTLEEEMDNYIKALTGNYTIDYMDFKESEKEHALLKGEMLDTVNIQKKYLDRKINNIAQLYFFNTLVKENNPILVSRDCGRGFGYDIYTTSNQDGMKKECLFEIKVVNNLDEFELTGTEYKTMVGANSSSMVDYYICLSQIDVSKNFSINNTILKACSITAFKDINSEKIYYLDFQKPGIFFKPENIKENDKQKKITL